VEPDYEKKLETLDDLLHSDVNYAYNSALNYIHDIIFSSEFNTFIKNKTPKVYCRDVPQCVERMITKRDIATIVPSFLVAYIARELGTVDVDKVVCSLDETIFSPSITVRFKRGNAIVESFNVLMRRYLEAGLMERQWRELQHRAALKGADRFGQAAGDMFLAFSVSQLKPAFVVLLVGTVLSSVVFIGEMIVGWLCKRRGMKPRVRGVRVLC
jgi:hypothetical protein